MTEEKKVNLDDERRRFFRIEDLIHLAFRVIDENELNFKADMLDKGLVDQFMITSCLATITADMASTLRKIEVVEPDVAAYLKSLDRKIDLIGRTFLTEEVQTDDHEAEAVNLSASGIAFSTKEALPIDANVELKMMLMPSFAGVLTYGKVIGNEIVEDETGRRNMTRIDFTHMREEDRDLLIRHVIRKQGDMLRERRIARENAE